MSKVKSFQLIIFAMIVLFIMFPAAGFGSMKTSGETSGPDRIVIQSESQLDKEMPPVGCYHDLHTKAVGDQCSACHIEDKGSMIFRFKRIRQF